LGPLDRIAAHCQVLAEQTDLNAAQEEDLLAIQQSTDQLLGHVGDILRLTVIEAGEEAPLEYEAVDVGEIARQVMQRHTFAAQVQSSVRCAPNLPIIHGDPHRLRQVVSNLVSNAAKFTRRGSVRLTVAPEGPGVRLEVSDSGPGIPEAELGRIFEEFHRVEAQRAVSGTGLGLAISRRIVERHGGQLWAESKLGEGSTFILRLPGAVE
jgi:signal transduction histidine kinase